ncbi:MAG: DUF6377 domain-containing protein [Bacteroides sp.]|nr:DUF6377 domain-containing protein [Bacteroides sp.]
MKKVVFLLLCCLSVFPFCFSGKENTLLLRLDRVLKERARYDHQKEQRLDSLRSLLAHTSSPDESYRLRDLLAGEYELYIADSAITYLGQNLEIAQAHPWKDRVTETLLKQAAALSISGMYKEAWDKRDQVRREELPDELLPLWYDLGRQLYSFMHTYSYRDGYAGEYLSQEKLYRDSLLMVLPLSSPVYRLYQAEETYAAGQLSVARQQLLALMDTLPDTSNIYARAAFTLAYIYRDEGHSDLYTSYLALSALSDVRASVKENAALQYLAVALYEEGDIDRAYRYIKSSLEDAIFCNARLRTVEISRMLPVIDAAYTQQVRQQRRQLVFFLVLVSLLSFFLIGALSAICRQIRRLRHTQEKLWQANHIKEEYIGHFLDLCSVYIEKLYHFRRTVHRKITAGQTDELLRMTKSAQRSDAEQQELYANFDRAFLHLYPDFVREFNELLQPGERYVLRSDELLNTEMRIYAFIRLGIDDTNKIAGFLHYSVNTIYTYRNKVKNKAMDREKFEKQVMKIGMI